MSLGHEVESSLEYADARQALVAFVDRVPAHDLHSEDTLRGNIHSYILSLRAEIPELSTSEPLTIEPVEAEGELPVIDPVTDNEQLGTIVQELMQPLGTESKTIVAPTHTIEFKKDKDNETETITVILSADAPRIEPLVSTSETEDITSEDVRPPQVELGKQFIIERNLDNARNALARLTLELRGKMSVDRKKNLQIDYTYALQAYNEANKAAMTEWAAQLAADGHDDESIVRKLSALNTAEHNRFSASEAVVYDTKHSKPIAWLYDKMAKTSTTKRIAGSTTAGAVITGVAGGALALTGVGLLAGAAAGLSMKAAKSLGMYKANKGMREVRAAGTKAKADAEAAGHIELDADAHIGKAIVAASDTLMKTIKSRVELDQKENRRNVKIAVASVALGAVFGSVVHELRSSANPFGGLRPKITARPVAHASSTPTRVGELQPRVPSPTSGYVDTTHHLPVRTPVANTPRPTHVSAARPNRVTEGPVTHGNRPTEVSVAEHIKPAQASQPAPRNIDLTRPTWGVAEQVAPGNIHNTMQHGIDSYNSLHGTHFALTPHNGSTWIIDNGRAINPAQMEELNRLMLADLETVGN